MSVPFRREIRAWWACAVALATCSSAQAISPDLELSQLYHSSWTAREGAPTGIAAIRQTPDGYLWLATAVGLFRFDGVRFTQFEGIGTERLPTNSIESLFTSPSGDVWVGYKFGGMSRVSAGHIVTFTEDDGLPTSTVNDIAQDPSGAVWAATNRGLFRFDGHRWEAASEHWNGPTVRTSSLALDGRGNLWVLCAGAVLYLPKGASRFEPVAIAAEHVDLGVIRITPDGMPWVFDYEAGGFALTPPDTTATGPKRSAQRLRLDRFDYLGALLIDRDGRMWRPSSKGMRSADWQGDDKRDTATDSIPPRSEALTSEFVICGFEDREGNIWFGTAAGLDKFREPRLQRMQWPDGVGPGASTLTAGEPNILWVGSPFGRVLRFDRGTEPELLAQLSDRVTSLYSDPHGVLWIGGRGELWRRGPEPGARLTQSLGRPDFLKNDVQSMALDGGGALWVSIVREGVFRIDPGAVWTRWGGRSDLPREPAVILGTDRNGGLWLGYTHDRLVHLENNRTTTFSKQAGLDVGNVLAIDARRAHTWAGGSGGVAWFDGQRFHALLGEGGRSFTGAAGVVETASGELWLHTIQGAVRIAADEVRQFVANPARPVRFDVLNYLDGMPGAPPSIAPVPALIERTNGELWFATENGVVRIDPKRIKHNALTPNVVIESVTADGVRHEPGSELRLPVHTRNLQIEYTALSFTITERVKFQYRLEGVDTDWQSVGTRRVAYFTDLQPGHYHFRVTACNDDGVWNEAGAGIDFVVPPTFVQTRWFLASCGLAVAAAAGFLFRLRLRQLNAAQRWRLEERLFERERIARELHDTFLQSVQGLILKFQSAAERIPEQEPARLLMERALERADQVLVEGRDRVTELRARTEGQADLLQQLQRIGDELMQESPAQFRLATDGVPRGLNPEVRDECCRIGSEALTNAFNHAHARQILLQIIFGARNLILRITDDGQGFDTASDKARNADGHWGLTGMRERAERIRARLSISSRIGEGSVVQLQVPARIAYRIARDSSWRRFWPRWLRLQNHDGV